LGLSAASGDQQRPVAASLANQSLVVWVDKRSGSKDIYAARVDASGKVLDTGGFVVSAAKGDQDRPRVAHDGKGYLVVWEDGRGSDFNIYAARVDAAGKVLDPAGVQVTKDAANQFAPAVAHGSKGYLLVWADLRNGKAFDIYGAMMDSSGKLLWSAPAAVSAGTHDEGEPAVAAASGGFLAVWSDARNSDKDIYGARLDASGKVLDSAGLALIKRAGVHGSPGVAGVGSGFVVTFVEQLAAGVAQARALLVAGNGVANGADVSLGAGTATQSWPSAGCSATACLVAWDDKRNGDRDILAVRVDAAGKVLDSKPLEPGKAAKDQDRVWVAHGGKQFLAVWSDWRGGVDRDIYGVRLDAVGKVLDSAALLISNAKPATATDGGAASDSGAISDSGPAGAEAGAADLGMIPDAGAAPDAGVAPDNGSSSDLGAAPDRGVSSDQGVAPDKGVSSDQAPPADSGATSGGGEESSGCQVAPGAGPVAGPLFILVALAMLKRRRAD